MKFDDGGVGPCSDCGNDVNVNSEVDDCKPKVLCPACQDDYLAKKKIKEIIDEDYREEKHYPKHSGENSRAYCHRIKFNERVRITQELKL